MLTFEASEAGTRSYSSESPQRRRQRWQPIEGRVERHIKPLLGNLKIRSGHRALISSDSNPSGQRGRNSGACENREAWARPRDWRPEGPPRGRSRFLGVIFSYRRPAGPSRRQSRSRESRSHAYKERTSAARRMTNTPPSARRSAACPSQTWPIAARDGALPRSFRAGGVAKRSRSHGRKSTL